MAKQRLPRVPDEVLEQIYNTLCEFGCARRKALSRYAQRAIIDSPYLTDEEKVNTEAFAEKAMQELANDKRISVVKYANEKVALPFRASEIKFETMDAFEVFVALVEELGKDKISSAFCHAGIGGHPFDFVFSVPKALYRVIVYNSDALSKINLSNATYSAAKEAAYITLIIFTEAYAAEDPGNLNVRGKYRLALITQEGKDRSCFISDVVEGE